MLQLAKFINTSDGFKEKNQVSIICGLEKSAKKNECELYSARSDEEEV